MSIDIQEKRLNKRFYTASVGLKTVARTNVKVTPKISEESMERWVKDIHAMGEIFLGLPYAGTIEITVTHYGYMTEGKVWCFDSHTMAGTQARLEKYLGVLGKYPVVSKHHFTMKIILELAVEEVFLSHEHRTVPFVELDTEPTEPPTVPKQVLLHSPLLN